MVAVEAHCIPEWLACVCVCARVCVCVCVICNTQLMSSLSIACTAIERWRSSTGKVAGRENVFRENS